MLKLPDRYNALETEKKQQKFWKEKQVYKWQNDLPKYQTFVIDTPPPTVSGLLHMGHIFSYTQADFVARYKRMRGFDVFYPMGFDDNGLPTERLVEKAIGKKAGVYEAENGRGSFVKECQKIVDEAEVEFENLFNSIALSVDWEQKYQTISSQSQQLSQASFVDLFNKNLVERRFAPVLWDTVDRTALSQADLVDKEMPSAMHDIRFKIEDGSEIIIATTRPELLPACVAVMVHPDDERYKHLHGKNAITALFGVKVPIIADELVQMDKGTGAVMCCTFGDETDIKWWQKHNLKLRNIVSENGTMLGRYVTANMEGEGISYYSLGCSSSKTKTSNLKIQESDCLNLKTFINFYEKNVAGKKIKEAREAIIEALKNTRYSHPPLEGESKCDSISGRGRNLSKATRFYSEETLQRAQELRNNKTDAEGFLWHHLRNKQLNNYKFRQQHPIDKYIVDFVCLEAKLIIELDGEQHAEEKAKKYDDQRTKFLENAGYKVLRFWNNEIFNNIFGVLDLIWFELENFSKNRNSDPSPNLASQDLTLPQGEGNNSATDLITPPLGGSRNCEAISVGGQSLLINSTPITHAVKCAERSGAPIEILVQPQWFVKILDKKEQLKAKAKECNWYPEYMRIRIEQWIDNLAWDWCISRQRYFGVPFPVWHSKRQGEEGKILVADFDQLPIDPQKDLPKGYTKDEVEAETDIMDTWATSSISPQLSSKGISNDFCLDKQRHEKLFPADMRPQAHEIIRTWAFYTIAKSMLHEDQIPWKNLMISGWCLAADKTKMSKSKGNVITPQSLIEEKGADVVRYWASASNLGADIAYSEELFKIGGKLITKLFNASKFVAQNFGDLKSEPTTVKQDVEKNIINEQADLWILSRLNQTIRKVEYEFDGESSPLFKGDSGCANESEHRARGIHAFEYAKARQAIEDFFWNDFCDNYLEIVKVRSYGLNAEKYKSLVVSHKSLEEEKIIAGQQSGLFTLYHCLEALLKLFAPFVPHICEELYQAIFSNKITSVHQRGSWPKLTDYIVDEEALKIGNVMLEVIFNVRKFKSDNNLSMKTPIQKFSVNSKISIYAVIEDLKNVCNTTEITTNNSINEPLISNLVLSNKE
jgi:valyl-tRNA synthetase/very-short-patch-repair endonuclease